MIRKLLLPLLGVALIGLVGCSDSPSESVADASYDLNAEFGGFTASAETPGFGDANLMAEADAEIDYEDPLLFSPGVDSLVQDADAGFFHFRVVWGRLDQDSTVSEVTDWTGKLELSRGAMVVRRLIRFEDGQDYLEERTDRKLIEWVSATTVHHDGIAVDMFFPRPRPMIDTSEVPQVDTLGDTTWMTVIDTTYPDPAEITFETGPYSHTFTLGDLVALDTMVELPDGNSVAFHAFKLDRVPCPKGFLAGRWGVDEEGRGVFRGMWMSRHGLIEGWLRGRYGVNNDGNRVFFGKWINKAGTFEGFLRGSYRQHANSYGSENGQGFRRGGGWFKGSVFNAERQEIGAVRGKFKSADHSAHPGYFQGLWKLHCGPDWGNSWDDDLDDDGWDDFDDDDDGEEDNGDGDGES